MRQERYPHPHPPPHIHTSPMLQDRAEQSARLHPGCDAFRGLNWVSVSRDLLLLVPPHQPTPGLPKPNRQDGKGLGLGGHSRGTASGPLPCLTESEAVMAYPGLRFPIAWLVGPKAVLERGNTTHSGQAKTLVYFSISNILAITKINSTKGDRSLYSEAKGSAARQQTSGVHGGHRPGNKLGSIRAGGVAECGPGLHF